MLIDGLEIRIVTRKKQVTDTETDQLAEVAEEFIDELREQLDALERRYAEQFRSNRLEIATAFVYR